MITRPQPQHPSHPKLPTHRADLTLGSMTADWLSLVYGGLIFPQRSLHHGPAITAAIKTLPLELFNWIALGTNITGGTKLPYWQQRGYTTKGQGDTSSGCRLTDAHRSGDTHIRSAKRKKVCVVIITRCSRCQTNHSRILCAGLFRFPGEFPRDQGICTTSTHCSIG